MLKLLLFIFGIVFSLQAFAQTGIGISVPDPSAKLEVNSNNKGFLPPRISLTGIYDQTTIPSPVKGLLVFCKGDAGLSAGYYFWNGAAWATIATEGGSGTVAAEFGAQYLPVSTFSILSGTPTDVLSFTLPSAGTWEVISFVRTQGTAGYASEFALYDASNTVVANSEILPAYGQQASTGTGSITITTTGASTYKIKAWASTGAYNVVSDYNGRTGVSWKKISGNTPMTVINHGDIKTGIQSADHNGWVKLNGRLKSSLSATQQTQATTLGIGTNLPDASNAFLVQNGTALGSVGGSNTKTISQSNLPNTTLTGSTSVGGDHAHNLGVAFSGTTAGWSISSGGAGYTWAGTTSTTSEGSHSHTISTSSINGGVTQTTFDVTPKSLSVNTFIYLGY